MSTQPQTIENFMSTGNNSRYNSITFYKNGLLGLENEELVVSRFNAVHKNRHGVINQIYQPNNFIYVDELNNELYINAADGINILQFKYNHVFYS